MEPPRADVAYWRISRHGRDLIEMSIRPPSGAVEALV
jgi:hypothetical protein